MLSIYFGSEKEAVYGPTWFKFNYDTGWFDDPFVQKMMEAVDHSHYRGGYLIQSDVLGPIPPEKLSGGLMTLILIYEKPDMLFDATSCGPNCAQWLLRIGDQKDVTVTLNYIMPFKGLDNIRIRIMNDGDIVTSSDEYILKAAKYL